MWSHNQEARGKHKEKSSTFSEEKLEEGGNLESLRVLPVYNKEPLKLLLRTLG